MIPCTLILVRVPNATGIDEIRHPEPVRCWIDPGRVDTITEIGDAYRKRENLPAAVAAVVRYFDPQRAFRLFYVEDSAEDLARMRWRALAGEDPTSPDYSGGR